MTVPGAEACWVNNAATSVTYSGQVSMLLGGPYETPVTNKFTNKSQPHIAKECPATIHTQTEISRPLLKSAVAVLQSSSSVAEFFTLCSVFIADHLQHCHYMCKITRRQCKIRDLETSRQPPSVPGRVHLCGSKTDMDPCRNRARYSIYILLPLTLPCDSWETAFATVRV